VESAKQPEQNTLIFFTASTFDDYDNSDDETSIISQLQEVGADLTISVTEKFISYKTLTDADLTISLTEKLISTESPTASYEQYSGNMFSAPPLALREQFMKLHPCQVYVDIPFNTKKLIIVKLQENTSMVLLT